MSQRPTVIKSLKRNALGRWHKFSRSNICTSPRKKPVVTVSTPSPPPCHPRLSVSGHSNDKRAPPKPRTNCRVELRVCLPFRGTRSRGDTIKKLSNAVGDEEVRRGDGFGICGAPPERQTRFIRRRLNSELKPVDGLHSGGCYLSPRFSKQQKKHAYVIAGELP